MDRRQSDSQENPARRAKPIVVALAGKCKHETVDSNEDQIDGRSEVENPGSVLLKSLHLVHAHHCHKTKNEHEKQETGNYQTHAGRIWKVFQPCSLRLAFFELFLLLVRQSTVIVMFLNDEVIHTKVRCKRT